MTTILRVTSIGVKRGAIFFFAVAKSRETLVHAGRHVLESGPTAPLTLANDLELARLPVWDAMLGEHPSQACADVVE
jgi:hypothetical protein